MTKIVKLSSVQKRTLRKLTNKWQSPYELSESIGTLDSLVSKHLAIRKYEQGYLFFPRSAIMYRIK